MSRFWKEPAPGARTQAPRGLDHHTPGSPPSTRSSYSFIGQQIKRVKPKRTTSFFSRQLSMGQGSYTVVQPTDSLEQG